jgi:hypothetical protein
VRADGDVLEHAHGRQQLHVLEGAAHAHAGDLARVVAGHRLAEEQHLARGRGVDARDLVEHRALARAVGADQREDLAGLDLQAHVVVGDQAAELAGDVLGLEDQLARLGQRAPRQRLGVGVDRLADCAHRHQLLEDRPQALAGAVQHQHHQQAEHDHLEVAAGAQQAGQPVLQPLLEHGDDARAHDRAPHVAGAADHRHEEVLDADVHAERGRVHEALHVRVQPARGAGEQRRDHEDHHARARGVHAHRLGHHPPALERADGAALARVEQVVGGEHGHEQEGPDQVVDLAAVVQRPAEAG